MNDLRQLAEAATPGPWAGSPHGSIIPEGANYAIASCVSNSGTYRNYEANTAYIAACSPERILALLNALEQIANPLKWEKEHLQEGYDLNYPMLLQMIERPNYYQEVARAAIRAASRTGDSA